MIPAPDTMISTGRQKSIMPSPVGGISLFVPGVCVPPDEGVPPDGGVSPGAGVPPGFCSPLAVNFAYKSTAPDRVVEMDVIFVVNAASLYQPSKV